MNGSIIIFALMTTLIVFIVIGILNVILDTDK